MLNQYKPEVRQKDKKKSRENDARLLDSGVVSPDELNRKNAIFSPFNIRKAVVAKRRLPVSV